MTNKIIDIIKQSIDHFDKRSDFIPNKKYPFAMHQHEKDALIESDGYDEIAERIDIVVI